MAMQKAKGTALSDHFPCSAYGIIHIYDWNGFAMLIGPFLNCTCGCLLDHLTKKLWIRNQSFVDQSFVDLACTKVTNVYTLIQYKLIFQVIEY